MSRYATPLLTPPQPPAPRPIIEGDQQFTGLNLKLPRQQLPEGTLARSENKRLRHGAGTRRGTRTPVWANVGVPTTAQLKGSGLYSNPNGTELLLLANPDSVYGVSSGATPLVINIPGPLVEAAEFVQHFNKVLLHRDDPSKPTLVWDGLSPALGFTAIKTTALGNGIAQIPNAPWSVSFLARAWFPIPGETDQIGASDIDDYATWDADLHKFQINLGTSDKIVGLYPYQNSALIVGKTRSIDVLPSIPGDLGDSFITAIALGLAPASAPPPSVQVVSTSIGMKARKCCVMVGGDLLFLSDAGDGGIYRITPNGGRLTVDPTPVSDPILPLIERINWDAAYRSSAALDGIYACFAVPVDGALAPNAMLVLNTVTGQWESLDLWAPTAMEIDNLVNLDTFGQARLYSISHPSARVRLMYEGLDDQMQPDETSTFPIADLLETRGYNTIGAEATIQRDFKRLEIMLESFTPSITVTELVNGEEEREFTGMPVTKDRTAYTAWNSTPFRLNNYGPRDFDEPRREDYAIELSDSIVAINSTTGVVGVSVERFAPSALHFATVTKGRFVSYRVANSTGACRVLSVMTESSGVVRGTRRSG